MATKQSSARQRPRAGSRSKSSSRQLSRYSYALLRRLAVLARPRTALDLLSLCLTILGVITAGIALPATIVRGVDAGPEVWLAAALFGAALAVRLSPWWRPHAAEMTIERLRSYVGFGVLLYAIASVSLHVAGTSLGLYQDYPLLGPMAGPPLAFLTLAVLVVVSGILIFDLPIAALVPPLYARAEQAISASRRRRTLSAATVPLPPSVWMDREESLSQDGPIPPAGDVTIPREAVAISPPPTLIPELRDELAGALPPIELFTPAPKGPAKPLDLDHISQRIMETLASFNVGARVVGYHCGPVVTQFDVQPDRGVKVKSITTLQNDLALALAAPTIRIQAPVPGKPVVGIEIPNSSATTVTVRELLENEAYVGLKSPLKVVLGKDVAGKPAVIDLAKMPHLLIAGATGSGKSVCVNALINCLLYSNTPEQVRLLMVDPKMVELTVYDGVPHLLSPVVTDMDKVVGVLQWAIREMERRYQLFKANSVRNIQRFNEKMTAANAQPLPYIVLIIDELADLMMVAPEDVEDAVCRLAQLARAAGIHLVIATQRPSVDVVTGLIKANFPARIAFNMTSQVDSRTILDKAGAEKLLGRGDMLYMPPDAPSPVRLQGAYLSDVEIEGLVDWWKRSPLQTAIERVNQEEFKAAERAAAEVGDELLDEAIRTVREFHHASVSLLQRRLRVGYARAARLMDQLEERGIVGPADGSKQRPVLQGPEETT